MTMKSISKEYLLLFNALTDAEETLRQLREELMAVQRQAEDLFLEEDGDEVCPELCRQTRMENFA